MPAASTLHRLGKLLPPVSVISKDCVPACHSSLVPCEPIAITPAAGSVPKASSMPGLAERKPPSSCSRQGLSSGTSSREGDVLHRPASQRELNKKRLMAWLQQHAAQLRTTILPLAEWLDALPTGLLCGCESIGAIKSELMHCMNELERGKMLLLVRRSRKDVTTWSVHLTPQSQPAETD